MESNGLLNSRTVSHRQWLNHRSCHDLKNIIRAIFKYSELGDRMMKFLLATTDKQREEESSRRHHSRIWTNIDRTVCCIKKMSRSGFEFVAPPIAPKQAENVIIVSPTNSKIEFGDEIVSCNPHALPSLKL